MLGRLLGMATLGVYGVAALVTEAIGGAVSRIAGGVFYPIFSRVSESEPEQLRSEYYFARLRVDAVALTILGGLSVLGDVVVHLLWDPRYADAGWMLRILCLRVAVACVMLPCEVCLVATGESRFGFARSVVTMIAIVIGVPIGYQLAGTEKLVWAVAISEIPTIFVLWPAAAKQACCLCPASYSPSASSRAAIARSRGAVHGRHPRMDLIGVERRGAFSAGPAQDTMATSRRKPIRMKASPIRR